MAEAGDALYVSFLGTKNPADLLTNLDLKRVPFLPSAPAAAAHRCACAPGTACRALLPAPHCCWLGAISVGGATHRAALTGAAARNMAVHMTRERTTKPWTFLRRRGYLKRVDGLPIRQLYSLAAAQGKRLVLTGHSLGGGVAVLAALRLLAELPPSLHDTVRVIGFATPPVGNAQLAAAVRAQGWDRNIVSYTLPEDW